MWPGIIIGGAVIALFLSRARSGNSSGVASNLASVEAAGIPRSIGLNTTDQQVTGGLVKAAAVDPEPITKSILAGAAKISGFFTAAHQRAVAKEAATLNNANPIFLNSVQQVVDGLNAGVLDSGTASNYLDQARDNYYATVQSIIKGHWPYQGSEFPEPTWADSYEHRTGPFGSHDSNPDSHAPDPCNAACVLAHYLVERTVYGLKKVIAAGGGQVVVEPFPNNGVIKGTPLVVFSYNRATGGLGPTLAGLFQRLGL